MTTTAELTAEIDRLGELRLRLAALADEERALAGLVRQRMQRAGVQAASGEKWTARLVEVFSLSLEPGDLRPLAESQGEWVSCLRVDMAKAKRAFGQEALEKLARRRKSVRLEVDPIGPPAAATQQERGCAG